MRVRRNVGSRASFSFFFPFSLCLFADCTSLSHSLVADKGNHSKMVMLALNLAGWRSYIAEPKRGRQHWEGQLEDRDAVHDNRRRKNGCRGRRLMRLRGEIIERTFAHAFETGGMRRTHLRHHENIAQRLLVHIAGFNLGLLMRKLFGA